ncbi:MAG: MlaD family protein [Lentisphaeraceae bacterium]|nr:MlaD family protein [Lentisphaeraceae bacterium]
MSIKEPASRLIKIEMIVGLFFILAIGILGYFTIILNPESGLDKKYERVVKFDENTGNLKDGANVRIKGVMVGRVSKVAMSEDYQSVLVTLNFDNKPKIYKDYRVKVIVSSLLGGEYLDIYIGTPAAGELGEDEILKGEAPRDLMGDAAEVVYEIRNSLEKDKLMDRLANILKNLEDSSQEMTKVFTHISEGKGTLGKLIYDEGVLSKIEEALAPFKEAGLSVQKAGDKVGTAADELTKFGTNLNVVMDEAKTGKGLLGKILYDEKAWTEFETSIANLKSFSEKLNSEDNTVGKILSDEGEIYNEFKDFVANLSEISDKINNGEGTLSMLINDDEAYNDLKAILKDGKKTLNEVKHAVQDFREQAPISTFGGIIFGTL